MECKNCGAQIKNGSYKCEYCGTEYEGPVQHITINNYNYQTNQDNNRNYYTSQMVYVSPKSRIVDLILCFLLGYFGIHKFYEGKVGMGILYIFTVGLFGIGWLVDLLVILIGKPKDKRGLPIKW